MPPENVTPGQELPIDQKPSSWPTLFGILAIVFGAIGCLDSAMEILTTTLLGDFQKALLSAEAPAPAYPEAQKMAEDMMAEATRWNIPSLVISVVLLGLAAILLIGGIKLLQRSFSARKLLIPWAWAKIGAGTAGSVVGLLIQRSQMDAIMATADTSGGGSGTLPVMNDVLTAFYGVAFFLRVIWVCALPVIFLIWLNRDLVKEDMKTWKDSPSLGPGA